jgi:hypothetical protein
VKALNIIFILSFSASAFAEATKMADKDLQRRFDVCYDQLTEINAVLHNFNSSSLVVTVNGKEIGKEDRRNMHIQALRTANECNSILDEIDGGGIPAGPGLQLN